MRWIVGDIHGMLRPLQSLVEAVGQLDTSPQWIFVGDYVNRGPESRGVIDFLLPLTNARFCRGNHDDILDLIVNGISFAEQPPQIDRPTAFRWFMEHGLSETLASYGIRPATMAAVLRHPTLAALDDLLSGIPQAHRNFLRNLQPTISDPDLFVTHAKWEINRSDMHPDIPTSLEMEHELRRVVTWGRFTMEELDEPKVWHRIGYFGHTPVDNYGSRGGFDRRGGGKLIPIVANKLVLVDTAAALSPVGRLTAYCHDTPQFIQSDRQGNII
ncbi:MAG: metallophosphoesterase [Tepidisphaeraceae bacterium]